MPWDDIELAKALAAGDEAAAMECDLRYRRQLEHVCRAQKVPAYDIGDVMQDIFLAMYRQAGRFRGESRLSTWLYPIARGCIADYWRKCPPRTTDASRSPEEGPSSASVEVPCADDLEARLIVEQVLSRMPPRLRFVLRLHERDGLKTREIAAYLNLSTGRTGALLAEAKQQFRRMLRGGEESPPRRRLKE